MIQEENTRAACIDFSFQYNSGKEFKKVEKRIYNHLIDISKECFKKGVKSGAIIVYGYFDLYKDHVVPGMRQIGVNPIQKYINITIPPFEKDFLLMIKENQDGSIIINRDGQILGSKIYLTVDNPILDLPDGCSTRHITAASFSTRKDVTAVFTLSEETLLVRVWKNGKISDQYNPELEEE